MGMFEYGEFRNHRLGRTIPVTVLQYRTSVYDKWVDYLEYKTDDGPQEAEARRDAERLKEEGKQVRIVNRRTFTAFKSKTYEFKVLEGIIKETETAPDMEEAQDEV